MSRKSIGYRIRQCRIQRRLTEKGLAECAGVPEEVIFQLEGGLYKGMTGRLLFLLARAMRVRLGQFLD